MRDLRRRTSSRFACLLTGTVAAMLTIAVTPSAYAQNAGWTWTLYADSTPVVLAQEIPDTPRLKTTLQCAPGTRQVQISLYDADAVAAGPVILKSGRQSSEGELRAASNRLAVSLPVDHPVFLAFQASGRLELKSGERVLPIIIEAAHLPKLARFAEACAS